MKPFTVFCLLLAISMTLPGPTLAENCTDGPCCGPIVRPRFNVEEEGRGNINIGGLTVLSGILAVGQALRDGSNKTAAAIDKNMEGQDAFLRQVVTGLGVSQEKAENMREFGPDSRAYNTFDDGYGPSVSAGLLARDQLSSKVREDLYVHLRAFDTKKEILDRLREAPSGFEPGNGDTLSAQDLAISKEIAKTIIDTYPALNLNDNLDRGRTAQDYGSARKAKEAKLIIPIAVLSDLIAARAPVEDLGAWSEKTYEKAGGAGSPSRTMEGKLSSNSLLGELVDMRFANQDWVEGENGIHSMTEAGVLRELLMTRVDKLMIEYEQMLWLDRMAGLMAQKQLFQNQEFDRVLNHAKIKTLQ